MWTQSRRLGLYILFIAGSCFASPKTEAWKVLHQGLKGKATHRAQAVAALGSLGPDCSAVRIVENALHDRSPDVREAAAAALGDMRCRKSIPQLRLALRDSDEQVSLAAAKALAAMGDMSGQNIFERLLTGQIKQGPGLVGTAIQDAREKMHDPGEIAMFGVRGASAANPFIGGPADVGVWIIRNALKDKGVQSRVTALNYLIEDPNPYAETLLEWALGDSSWTVRATAVKGLGDRGDPAAIPKLEPLLKDGHHVVRYMAAATIVRLSSLRATG